MTHPVQTHPALITNGPGESTRAEIFRLVKTFGPIRMFQLMERTRLARTSIRKHLQRLTKAGLVTKVGYRNAGTYVAIDGETCPPDRSLASSITGRVPVHRMLAMMALSEAGMAGPGVLGRALYPHSPRARATELAGEALQDLENVGAAERCSETGLYELSQKGRKYVPQNP